MKLSNRELELVSNAPKSRQVRKRAAWTSLIFSLVLLIGVDYFNYDVRFLGSMLAAVVGISAGEVAAAYVRVREEDKLVDLLLRYVNSDPEALKQVSIKSGSMRSAAEA